MMATLFLFDLESEKLQIFGCAFLKRKCLQSVIFVCEFSSGVSSGQAQVIEAIEVTF